MLQAVNIVMQVVALQYKISYYLLHPGQCEPFSGFGRVVFTNLLQDENVYSPNLLSLSGTSQMVHLPLSMSIDHTLEAATQIREFMNMILVLLIGTGCNK